MPLAFPSLSHGTVAFGFYNIETDGLLLDRLFFFCTDFCRAVGDLAALGTARDGGASLAGFEFVRPEEIGDLMAAIGGRSREGFFGEIYRLWPFPEDPRQFRQKPHGARNRAPVEEVLRRRAVPVEIVLATDPLHATAQIGPYRFSGQTFLELLLYLWRGGLPTWEGFEAGVLPAGVAELAGWAEELGRALGTPVRWPGIGEGE